MKSLFSLFLFLCVFLPAGHAARIYVNSNTGNDANTGASWGQAVKTLQKALEKSSNGDELWLAGGVYYPTKDHFGQTDPIVKGFLGFYISKALSIYGRFDGTETTIAQRNANNPPSIISGDVEGNDLTTIPQSHDDIVGSNSFLLMNIQPTVSGMRLDDLVFTAADGDGGLQILNGGSFVVTKCRIAGNFGYESRDGFAGALFLGSTGGQCAPLIDNCTFDHNNNQLGTSGCFVWAASGPAFANINNCVFSDNTGGGFGAFAANGLPCTVNLNHCTFSNNKGLSSEYGAGINCSSANLTCQNSTFNGNQAYLGGAISLADGYGVYAATVSNCLFTNNKSHFGGGALYFHNIDVTLSASHFSNNSSEYGDGGAIYDYQYSFAGASNFVCEGNSFSGNSAALNGGAIYYNDPTLELKLSKCNFYNNTAASGGAVCVDFLTDCVVPMKIDLSIFDSNTASGYGGAVYLKQAAGTSYNSGFQINSSTFYKNESSLGGTTLYSDRMKFKGSHLISWGSASVGNGEFGAENGASIDVNYSLLQSADCSTSGITTCNRNIYSHDPLFVNAANSNFRLQMCSPAVNTGFQTNTPGSDYLGNPRPYSDGASTLDMGAYEYQGTPAGTFYLDQDYDGYGVATYKIRACTAPPGFTSLTGDCNDSDASVNPGAAEICDGKDNNCNNLIDSADPNHVDNEAPVFTTTAPANLNLSCTDQIPAVAVMTATDNCTANPVVTFTTSSTRSGNANDCAYYSYTITRSWTATDLKNNSTSVTQLISVKDEQPPVFNSVSANATISCEQSVPGYFQPSVSDNCSGVTVKLETTSTRSGNANDCAYYSYTITRTWTATDKCNNSATAQQVITVQDNKAPFVLFPPAPQIFIECNQAIPQITSLASQDCDAHPILSVTEEEETLDATPFNHLVRRITRHITLTDHCGNAVEFQQVINIRDTKAPIITNCPANITVQGSQSGAIVNFEAANVIEACEYELVYTPYEPGSNFPLGTTQMYIDVYDKGANYSSCAFTVTVLDAFKVHCQPDVFASIPVGSSPDKNTINWNMPFAEACNFCDVQAAQADFQQDLRYLGNLKGHRYYVSNYKLNPQDAEISCSERQGYLVSIGDKTENNFLANELGGQAVLIGLNDGNHEGSFVWANGQNPLFSNWAANNPLSGTDAQDHDFVQLGAGGRWFNTGNDSSLFVCEINCYDVKKVDGNTAADHVLTRGNYFERYTITDICGGTDTCRQNVLVNRTLLSYCSPNFYPSALDKDTTLWIKSIRFGDLKQQTGNNKGYYRQVNSAPLFETGKTYPLDVVTATTQSGPANTYVRVWLDMNADRDFYDAGELLIDTFLPDGELHTSVFIPKDVVTGEKRQRLRIATSRFSAPEACGDFTNGEMEDYRLAFFGSSVNHTKSDRSIVSVGAFLYPNPASDAAWVSLEDYKGKSCTLRVLSVTGVNMRTINVAQADENALKLDLSNLSSGVYFVQIQAEGSPLQTEKLVVEQD